MSRKLRESCAPAFCALALCALGWIGAASAHGGIITGANIVPVPQNTVGSGNGTLDYLLFTESAGGSQNSGGSFNGDNANTHLPTGNGNTTANESFVTSVGEMRDFFRLNFPNGQGGSTVNQLVVMFDVNETGGLQTINVNTFEIIRNVNPFAPANDSRNDPLSNDINSATQNGTNATFSGGTMLANTVVTHVLGQVSVGAGFADQAIFTGFNPFDPSYLDSDRILVHVALSDMDNGGETIFVSGKIAPQDLNVPEPATATLATMGVAGLLWRRPRCG